MGFFQRLFGGGPPKDDRPEGGEQHAVLLNIVLEGTMPTEAEMVEGHALQDELLEAIEKAGAGELDGDEWGGGTCTVFMYGPDADRLWDAIEPVLARKPFRKGSFAIKRYGGPEEARQDRVNLEWDG